MEIDNLTYLNTPKHAICQSTGHVGTRAEGRRRQLKGNKG
jgi:hypothetical protein